MIKNNVYIYMLIFYICAPLQASNYVEIEQNIQSLLTELDDLQKEARKNNTSGNIVMPKIQTIQNALSNLQYNAQNLTQKNSDEKKSQKKPSTDLASLSKVSDKEVKKAHEGPSLPQTPTTQINTTVKTQSMENGNDDFNNIPDTSDNSPAAQLHVVDSETDANADPDKNPHQSFFLGEGMVGIQALLPQTVDAFSAKNKRDKKIGSYKRSLNYVQGYSLGTLTIGKKSIQVLEDNAASRIPILATIKKGIQKKPIAYIKNPAYNKMIPKSPVIINLYEYKP